MTFRCAVCGEPVEERMSAACNWCDQRYHLNQRNDIEAKDCGQVWIDEQYMALQFACNNCLADGGSDPSLADNPRAVRRIPVRPRPAARLRRYRRRI
ncbi:MAG: hypothetical protein KGK07_01165 [Chloroflexota bacterium]|nr:hypothetical protein [Chloroflexota bacterium]